MSRPSLFEIEFYQRYRSTRRIHSYATGGCCHLCRWKENGMFRIRERRNSIDYGERERRIHLAANALTSAERKDPISSGSYLFDYYVFIESSLRAETILSLQ